MACSPLVVELIQQQFQHLLPANAQAVGKTLKPTSTRGLSFTVLTLNSWPRRLDH